MKSLALFLLLVFLSGVHSQTCTAYESAFDDRNTSALADPNKTPLGYRRDNLPNPDYMLPNPCYTIQIENSNQYVELAVQVLPVTLNARICVRMGGPEVEGNCDSNTAYLCGSNIADNGTVTVTVYCDDSCDRSDTAFFYRIRLSPVLTDGQDNEDWCMNQPRDLPSSLLIGVTPSEITPPTVFTSAASTVHTVVLPLLVMLAILIASLH